MSTDTALILRLRAIDESQGVLAAARARLAEFDAQVAAMNGHAAERAASQRAMADSVAATGVSAGSSVATLEKLSTSLNGTAASSRTAQTSVAALGTTLRGDVKTALNQAAAESMGLRDATGQSAASVVAAESKYAQYQVAVRSVSTDVSKLGSQLRGDLRTALNQAATDTSKFGHVTDATRLQVSGARQALSDYEKGIRAAGSSAAQQEAALLKVGKAAGLVSVGLVAAGAVSVDMAAKFEAAMERVHTQAGASQQEVDRLKSKILELSGTTATGPEQLATALYHVESAGFRGAKALDMVKLAAEGAKVGNADLEATTQAVIGVMASQIKGISNSTDAMAFLNATVGAGDMKMQQLDQGIATGILPAFHNFGLGAIDAGAALATLTDNVTPADEAATRLRMTVALLGAPSASAAKALQAIGLSASEANAALAHRDELAQYGVHVTDLAADLRKPDGLLVALEDLQSHLKASGLTASEQGAVISKAFGGGRSSGAIETLLGELDRLRAKYGDIHAGEKKFLDDFEATQRTTAYQAAQADANAQRLGVTFGTTLLPMANDFLNLTADIGGNTASWVQQNQKLADGIAGLVGGSLGVLALSAGVLKVRDGFKMVQKAAEAARLAEIAAFAVSPLGIIAAGAGIAAYYGNKQKNDSNTANLAQAQRDLTKAFDEGKISESQAKEILKQLDALAELTGTHIKHLTLSKLEDSRAKYQDHIHAEADALHHLSSELTGNVLSWTKALDAKQKYYAFDGKNVPGGFDPKTSVATSLTAPKDYLSTAVSAAQTDLQKKADQVAYDTNVLHITVQKHVDELSRATAKYVGLETEQSKLTNTSKDLHAALLQQDRYTRDSNAASVKATAAEHVLADELARGITPTRAQWQEFERTTAESKKYTDALASLEGKTKTTASALEVLQKAALKGNATPAEYEAAAVAQQRVTEKNDVLAGVTDGLNRKMGLFGSTVDDTRTRLQNDFDNAQAKFTYDSSHGAGPGVLGADEADIRKTKASLDGFNRSVDSASRVTQSLSQTEQARLQALQQAVDDAHARLVLDSAHGASDHVLAIDAAKLRDAEGHLDSFKSSVSAADKVVSDFDSGLKHVVETFSDVNDRLQGYITHDTGGLATAILKNGGKMPADAQALLAAGQAEYQALQRRIRAENLATDLIEGHTKSDSARVDAETQRRQNTLNRAEAQRDLDVLHGNRDALAEDNTRIQKAGEALDWWTGVIKKSGDQVNQVDTHVVAGFPGARFGEIGQPSASAPSIASLGSGFGGTVAGIIAGGQKLKSTFEQQVQAGLDQIQTSKQQDAVNLEVARRSGDTATAFSILDKEYLAGDATLAQVDQAYKENQGTILASTRRQIDYDKSIGDTGDELTQTLSLYHQGNASLDELTQAYKDNQIQVEKNTAADEAYFHSTGQFGAELQSRQQQATQRQTDAEALLTEKIHDRIPVSVAEVQAARDAVQETRDWTDAQRQATEMVGTIPEKWDAMLQDMQTGLDNATKTLASDLLGGMTDSNFGEQLKNDAEAGAVFYARTQEMSAAEAEARIRILEAAGAFGDAHSQELEAAKSRADADYANASAAGASADQLQQLYQAASDASYALTAWENTLSSPDNAGSQDANQQSFDLNGFETSYGYQQDQQAYQDYESNLTSMLQQEQAAVTQGIKDGFDSQNAMADRKKLDLEHQKAMIQLNTSLDPQTKAYQIQAIQLQEDDLAISTDELKYQELAATGGTMSELLQAQNQILADTYKKQEDIAAGVQQIATNTGNDSAALASQVKTLEALLQQRNSPAGSARTLRNPGSNTTLSQLMGPQAADFQTTVMP